MNGAGDSHDRAAAQLLMQGTFGPNRSYGDAFDIVDDFLSRIHPSINQSFRIYHLTLVVRYPNSVPMGADFVLATRCSARCLLDVGLQGHCPSQRRSRSLPTQAVAEVAEEWMQE